MKFDTIIKQYWKDTLSQNAMEMKTYFTDDAYVNWHNSNEHFQVDEFIRANCEYPSTWDGQIEKMFEISNLYICIVHVYTKDQHLSFHVTSLIHMNEQGLITSIDEYWGDDGEAPKWRKELHIGTKIK